MWEDSKWKGRRIRLRQSSGAVWKSRWTSWAPVPNKPAVSVDVKQHFNNIRMRRLVLTICCRNCLHMNTLWVTRCVQLCVAKCFAQSGRIVCVTVSYYPVTLVATRTPLSGQLSPVLEGGCCYTRSLYHGWRKPPHNCSVQRITTF